MADWCRGRNSESVPTPGKADTGVGTDSESRPDVRRLSDSSGDRAMTRTGLHPMPADSHGACRLTHGRTMATDFWRGRNAPSRCRVSVPSRWSIAAIAARNRGAAAGVCVQKHSTPRAPCEFSRFARELAQALTRKRPIRDLSPSACLPFQARGQVPDRAPDASLISFLLRRDPLAMELRAPEHLR